MNKTIAILLTSLIISLTFKDLLTYAHFYVNRDFISRTLCINRDKPKTNCRGKCYLNKLIQENQEQEKNIPNPIKEKKSNIVFLPTIDRFLPGIANTNKKRKRISYTPGSYSFAFSNEIFHPPQLMQFC